MDEEEICKFCGLEFGNKSVLKVHYSIVHQGDEQINKSDSIQGIPPEKNMNFETTMKTQNEKKTLKSNFLLKEDWNQQQKKILCEQQNTNLDDGSKIQQFNNQSKIKLLCPFCTLSYPSKKCLNRHVATAHEEKMQEKEFKCTLCDNAAFTQKHNLTKHIESFHEGKKAFVCNICDKRFVQKIHLKNHIESLHEGKKRSSRKKKELTIVAI